MDENTRQIPNPPDFNLPGDPSLSGRFLSNGRFRVHIDGTGSGRSLSDGIDLIRGSDDPIDRSFGLFLYLRDRESGTYHSIGTSPVRGRPENYRASWEPGRVTLERKDEGIRSRVEIGVPPDDTVEIRLVTVRNESDRKRTLDLTTYAEVVLAPREADAAHPAFSKLFIQTEYNAGRETLLASRRPRANGETHPWLFHVLRGEGGLEWETDRFRFLGRGRTPAAPHALRESSALSGTTGAVLDPVVSLRRSFSLVPGEETIFLVVLGAAPSRKEALEKSGSWSSVEAAHEGIAAARRRGKETIEAAELTEDEAEYFEALASSLLQHHPSLRPNVDATLEEVGESAPSSGSVMIPDQPFVFVPGESTTAVTALHRASAYWERLGLSIPIVLPGEGDAERMSLEAAAGLVVSGDLPDLGAFAFAASAAEPGEENEPIENTPERAPDRMPLRFDNGFGGFSEDGHEYVIRIRHDPERGLCLPPLPWVNIVANDRLGFQVSETGAGCTWSGNSREHRLTPWSNDPVRDPHDEALYIRDEETGDFWSPLPGPAPAAADYETRHGFGQTLFHHASHGLEQTTRIFAPKEDPLKIVRLCLTNRGDRKRPVSIVSYRRLVLGVSPERSGRFVTTRIDPETNALFAWNRWSRDYPERVTFAAVVPPAKSGAVHLSGDRRAFLGPEGDVSKPAALSRPGPVRGATGAGLDAGFMEQMMLDVEPGECVECSFLFGEGENAEEARALIAAYRREGRVEEAIDAIRDEWERNLSGLRISTPRPALDLMVNGWLPYQTLACRMRGRTAFYQSGGAFGFRDQLQDASSLLFQLPGKTREQILLHAAHQFVEGDVLHWWHPPKSRGIRTRFADDLLWLPCVTAYYIRSTGDRSILDEKVRFLTARALMPGEDEAFLEPTDSGIVADLYEHCCRAIDRSLETGAHGLPLFGTGDWNDGMNRVGREGKGESVWMAFFLIHVLQRFLPYVEERGDRERTGRYDTARERLEEAVNKAGWDGEWYRRGYYDDGSPLGSKESDECRIDALVQAWSVISGGAPRERAGRAMDAAVRELVSEEEGIIRLLTPAFDRTPHDPGYIKGYVPGVRENGGQYTHAALWLVRALAELGRNEKAARLLEMLTPVAHGGTAEGIETYLVEPYVVAADVYGEPPHVGRGGWTWYTGSSAWMFRVAVESVLGIRIEEGESLRIRPCVPDDWPRYDVTWRVPGEETVYEIAVENPRRRARAVIEATLDGEPLQVQDGAACVPIHRDGGIHRVLVTVG